MSLKRGRPRESEAGKCRGISPPLKKYENKSFCSHQLANSMTYAEVAEVMDCTLHTVYNRQRNYHKIVFEDEKLDSHLN